MTKHPAPAGKLLSELLYMAVTGVFMGCPADCCSRLQLALARRQQAEAVRALWLRGGSGVALGWLWGGSGVALGCLRGVLRLGTRRTRRTQAYWTRGSGRVYGVPEAP
jgi:hypothetical protein